MAIYKLGLIHPRLEFVGVEILTIFWVLWHSFGSRYARKPIKVSKDLDDSLVSKKNLNEKIRSLDCRPGPRKVRHKTQKRTNTYDVPQRTPNPKRKHFFNRN